ncbi:MAG: hypothetical protein JJV89_06160 [Desulfosarcina sp.]|nr:hypothetical protein [Desulfobacterales bacterium]
MINNLYFFYILIALLYPIVKVIYFFNKVVCTQGIILGIVMAVVTICPGLLAIKECSDNHGKRLGHLLAVWIPVIAIPIFPLPMVAKFGTEIFTPGPLSVLIIFIILALMQIYCAVLEIKDFKTKINSGN